MNAPASAAAKVDAVRNIRQFSTLIEQLLHSAGHCDYISDVSTLCTQAFGELEALQAEHITIYDSKAQLRAARGILRRLQVLAGQFIERRASDARDNLSNVNATRIQSAVDSMLYQTSILYRQYTRSQLPSRHGR